MHAYKVGSIHLFDKPNAHVHAYVLHNLLNRYLIRCLDEHTACAHIIYITRSEAGAFRSHTVTQGAGSFRTTFEND